MNIQNRFKEMKELVNVIPEFEKFTKDIDAFYKYYQDPTRLLIMGEFSVGKSTIINVLLDREILPSSITPTTAVPTYIRYAKQEQMEIMYKDGRIEKRALDQLALFSSERVAVGSAQREQVDHISLYVNHPLLQTIVIVDSPGLNSAISSHTNQTLNTIDQVDDGIWIFNYGKVGGETERQQLNALNEVGITPLGVINMIDQSDEDELNDYYSYELSKLKPHIRDMIGISALEAKNGKDSNDDELYEMSEFPNFISKIEEIAQNKALKQASFSKKFGAFLQSLLQNMKVITYGVNYKNDLQQVEHLKLQIDTYTELSKQELVEQLKQIEFEETIVTRAMQHDKPFLSWIKNEETKFLSDNIPYQKWYEFAVEYELLSKELRDFNEKARSFNDEMAEVFGSPIQWIKRSKIDVNTIQKAKQRFKSLKMQEEMLQANIKKMNEQHKQIEEQLQGHAESIKSAYEKQLETVQAKRDTVRTQTNEIQAQNKKTFIQAMEQIKKWEPMEELKNTINALSNLLTLSLNLNDLHFPHFKERISMEHFFEQKKEEIHRTVETTNSQPIWNHRIELPVILDYPEKIKNYFFVNYRPTIAFVTIPMIIAFLVVGVAQTPTIIEALGWNQENDDYAYGESDYSTEDVNYEESGGTYYLTYDFRYNNSDLAIGELYLYEDAPVYEGYDEALTEFVAKAGTTWEVYEVYEDWYKIQNYFWLYLPNRNGYSYTPNIFVQNHSDEQVLATVYTAMDDYVVYDSPSTEATTRPLNLETYYDIYAVSEKGWFKLGENTWLKYEDWMQLDQFEMNTRLQQSDYLLRIERTTNPLVPIFEGPDRSSRVIGLLEDIQDVYISETVNAEWVKVGQNAWIEANKYLAIDWVYQDYNNLSRLLIN